MNSKWYHAQLGDHIDLLTGFPFSSAEYIEDPNAITLIRGANIGQGFLKWNDTAMWPSNKATEHENYALRVGDIVLAMDRPWIPAGIKYAWITEQELPCLLVQRVARIRGRDSLLTEYIRHLLASNQFTNYVRRSLTGTNVPHISASDIKNYRFPIPPLPEQRKIAAILSTWDEAITLTERLIAALQRRKKGLMQRLLTGQVRFPEFEGDEWKEVKLPQILLDEKGSIKVGPFGSQLKKSEMVESGYKVYGQENVFGGDFVLGERYISEEKYQALRTCEIESGDFLITMMGTIGKCAIVPKEIETGIMDSHLMRLRTNPDKYHKPFLAYLFQSYEIIKQVSRLSVGGIMDGLSSKIVKELRLPHPSVEEQDRISQVFASIDEAIHNMASYRDYLAIQKKGLMQRLLTGQIRVQVDK